ncbi:DUF551 domain-containing protein [Klebsiella pneumoniae]|uniref:DUF551 domain-containing protein n=1 Tax=Klebsiella pneumoniae TaxID=573 RepID=UPI003F806097
MSEFSRETLLNIIETDHVQCGEASALARMALAAMDSSESVELPLDYLQGHKDGLEWAARLAEANHPETGDWLYDDPIELAKAIRKGPDMPPVQPVADSEPDRNPVLAYADSYRDMAKQGVESVPIWSVITDLERNIAPLYRHAQPAPAAPVCTCPSGDGSLRWPCPVHTGNSPVIPDGWTGNEKANAALMMLDRIETVDPVDDDRIDGIKRIVRELAAAPHDTPALNSVQSVVTVLGKWIPVSERIPDNTEPVLCIEKRADFGTYGQPFVCWHDGGGWVGKTNYRPIVTHWMPLPAGPQEVR